MEEQGIKLTLDPEVGLQEEVLQHAEEAAGAIMQEKAEVKLTPEEEKTVAEFARSIDVADAAVVMKYGAACQEKMTQLSDNVLKDVAAKDFGEVGGMITKLVTELEGFGQEEEKKGFLGLFKKPVSALAGLKNRYSSAEANVDKITEVLTDHQNKLSRDAVAFDELYASNLSYFKELSMYILAGRQALEEAKNGKLKELEAKAKESNLPEDAQAANDFSAAIDRFEKKIHDLELTRTVSMQMAPQIRLIQNNDMLMVERIQSTISNTIPLWKNQMVLALGMQHSKEAMEAQRQVTDLTNEMLVKNAEALHQGSVEVARESERSIVDAESLKKSNEELISSLKEVIQIQEEGRNKRALVENELLQIENELKQTLLDIRNKA